MIYFNLDIRDCPPHNILVSKLKEIRLDIPTYGHYRTVGCLKNSQRWFNCGLGEGTKRGFQLNIFIQVTEDGNKRTLIKLPYFLACTAPLYIIFTLF